MRGLAAVAAALVLGGCANVSRMVSYGTGWADAIVTLNGVRMEMYAHPSDPTVMMQVWIGRVMGQQVLEMVTLGLADNGPGIETWRAGARWLVEPAGCKVEELRPLDQADTWEARYACPEGVDLRALIEAQRDQLREGRQLRNEQRARG